MKYSIVLIRVYTLLCYIYLLIFHHDLNHFRVPHLTNEMLKRSHVIADLRKETNEMLKRSHVIADLRKETNEMLKRSHVIADLRKETNEMLKRSHVIADLRKETNPVFIFRYVPLFFADR